MTKISLSNTQSLLALDIGDARIGVARAGVVAKIPEPLQTLTNNSGFSKLLAELITKEDVGLIVVGLPRNLKGEETAQSKKIRNFVEELKKEINEDFVFADESLSSKRADEYLKSVKSPGVSQDSIAACYILEEYFNITKNAAHEIF